MSNAYTYQHLSQAEKDCVDMIDQKDMLTLMKDGDDILFYRIHSILCDKVKDKQPLTDDQEDCLVLPYRLWGSMAGYELYKIKKKWDDMKAIPKSDRQGYKYTKKRDVPF